MNIAEGECEVDPPGLPLCWVTVPGGPLCDKGGINRVTSNGDSWKASSSLSLPHSFLLQRRRYNSAAISPVLSKVREYNIGTKCTREHRF